MISTLIFIHGWASSPEVWRKQEEHFTSRYKVIVPDISRAADIRQAAQMIAAAAEDGRAFVLVGWSLGWLAVVEALKSFRIGPAGLVSVSSTAKFVDDGYLGAGPTKAHLAKMMRDCRRDPTKAVADFHKAAFADVADGAFRMPDYDSLLCGLEMLMTCDYRDYLERIRVPTLLIAGASDTICPKEASLYMQGRIPGARLGILDCCHAPFLAKAEEFNGLVDAFVRSL